MIDVKIKLLVIVILSIILCYINRKNQTAPSPPPPIPTPVIINPVAEERLNTTAILLEHMPPMKNDQDPVSVKDLQDLKQIKKIHKPAQRHAIRLKPSQMVCNYFDYRKAQFNQLVARLKAVKKNCRKSSGWFGFFGQKTPCKEENKKQINPGVVWCVVGLLVISLIAAIVDFVVTKTNSLKKQSSVDSTGKPGQLTRRCSLASLTVSRHERRQAYASRRPSTILDNQSKKYNKDSSGTGVNSRSNNPPTRVKFIT